MPHRFVAFTLIELLVVITIIVVLLSLLTPALDSALYQSKLAVCAANLDGTVTAMLAYAMEHRRKYAWKPSVHEDGLASSARNLYAPWNYGRPPEAPYRYDHRWTVRDFIAVKRFMDPFSGDVDLSIDGTDDDGTVAAAFSLWDGMQYGRTAPARQQGMLRMGNRLRWNEYSFNVLAGDSLKYLRNQAQVITTHTDREGTLTLLERQNGGIGAPQFPKMTYSHWYTPEGVHGTMDLNYGMQDGSVRRIAGLTFDPEVINNAAAAAEQEFPLRALPANAAGGYDNYNPNQQVWNLPDN